MAVTPSRRASEGNTIKYTPGSAVVAGQVVVLNNQVTIAPDAIAASTEGVVDTSGCFDVPKSSEAWSQGDEIFYNSTGDPYGGDAGSGCFTNVGAGNVYAGVTPMAVAANTSKGKLILIPSRSRTNTVKTVAAAGSAQGDAAALVDGFNLVTGADGTKGVLLPAAYLGRNVTIKNNTNAVLKVYPSTGDAVNALSANAAMSIAAFTCPTYTAIDATTWMSAPLLPS